MYSTLFLSVAHVHVTSCHFISTHAIDTAILPCEGSSTPYRACPKRHQKYCYLDMMNARHVSCNRCQNIVQVPSKLSSCGGGYGCVRVDEM